MIGNATSGADFGGLARYLTCKQDRVGFTELRNMASRDVREAAREMQITSEQSTRCQKPVYHVSISFARKDAPTEFQQREAIERMLKDLDLDTHQAMIVSHRDTAHPHVHVMVNRVHPETGKAWSTSHDRRRIRGVLRKLEKEWGMQQVPDRRQGEHKTSPFAQELRERIGEKLKATRDWADYQHVVTSEGLHLKLHSRGLVLTDGRQYAAAGRVSESLPVLSKRFGETLQEHRVRLAESALAPASGKALVHRIVPGTVSSLQGGLHDPSKEDAIRWGTVQVHRALLQAVARAHPEVQRLVRNARQMERHGRQLQRLHMVQQELQKEQSALQSYRRAERNTQAFHEAFRNALEPWYTDPDAACEAFYRMSRDFGPEVARQTMEHNSTEFGRRRLRGRFQKLHGPARLGEQAARMWMRLPGQYVEESNLGLLADQLHSRLPENSERSRGEMGKIVRGLTEGEMKLARQVLGNSVVRGLNAAWTIAEQRERERESDLGL